MNLPITPVIAGVLGGAVALGALAVPTPMLEGLVMHSGLPAILAAAEPPLGLTARAGFALGAGGFAALFSWTALGLLLGPRDTIGGGEALDSDAVAMPVLRRADAHPDAPPRPPLLATRDLGRPFPELRTPAEPELVKEVEEARAAPVAIAPVEQPLPQDLDQPLAAFDPDAMPDVPMPPPVALAPLRRAPAPPVFEHAERFETFELRPPVAPIPQATPRLVSRDDAIARPETEASVHALLDRLERGVIRKAIAPAPAQVPLPMSAARIERRAKERGLEDALITLRNLARRA